MTPAMTKAEIVSKARELADLSQFHHVAVSTPAIAMALLEVRNQAIKDAAAIFKGEGSTTYAAVRSTLLSLVEG